MRAVLIASGAALMAAAFVSHGALAANPPQSAQSLECSKQADAKGLHGKAREHFRSACKKGGGGAPTPLTPKTPTAPTANTREAQAITKPSGVDRTTRSAQCDAEASKRGLTSKARDAFKLNCLATAAPVGASQSPGHNPRPTKAIPHLGTQTSNSSAPPR